jgi:hypothetical protein
VVVLPLAVAIGVVVLPAAASAAAKPGDTEIEARWTALGGEGGVLGPKKPPPEDRPYDVPDVPDTRAQDFANGRIYWSADTGAQALLGPVLEKYLAVGGPSSVLKLPAAEEAAVAGGTRTVFQGGHIYRSAAGAYVVRGPILATYLAAGASSGALGMPTSDPLPRAVAGSLVNTFAKGRIYWSSPTGARAVYGAILTKYLQIGAERSYLGLPTTSEYAVTGGRRSRFTGGYITKLSGKPAVVTGYWRPSVLRVTAAEMPYTYRSGCPVGPTGLRRVKLPYYDWAGVPRMGDIVLRTSAADDMQRVFSKAFSAKFPIRQMRLVDVYKGNDVTSMAADNTSAFNCRKVTGNPYRLSQHSYGHAIDINTFENPYVTASRVYPSGSGTYLNRRNVRKGMIVSSGVLAKAMRTEGWPWGARWSHPDYQHFSANGG